MDVCMDACVNICTYVCAAYVHVSGVVAWCLVFAGSHYVGSRLGVPGRAVHGNFCQSVAHGKVALDSEIFVSM